MITVITLTLDAKRNATYKNKHKRFNEIQSKIKNKLLPILEEYFEEDSTVFDQVIKLREKRDIENNEDKKSNIVKSLNNTLLLATDIPIKISNICVELAHLALEVFDNGFKSARGDSGVAINSAISGISGCLSIIEINLLSITPSERKLKIRRQRTELINSLNKLNKEARLRLDNQLKTSESKAFNQFKNEINQISHEAKSTNHISAHKIEQFAIQLQRAIWKDRDLLLGDNKTDNPFDLLDPKIIINYFNYKFETKTDLGSFSDRGNHFKVAGIIDQNHRIITISEQFQ